MFNEGIHVADVDGVILFRPTISPIIYKQQIGRALSVMKGGVPLIIDAVNNFENLFSISSVQADLRMPRQYVQNGIKLWVWLNCQHRKAKQGKLNAEQLKKLGEIGFFDNLPRNRSWENNYHEAKRYFEANGGVTPATPSSCARWRGHC